MLFRVRVSFGFAVSLCVLWALPAGWAATTANPLPEWKDVEKVVLSHFASIPDYRKGDLVTQGDVDPVFAKLKAIGFDVAARKQILAAVPSDGEFLVRQLRSRQGRPFMRQMSGFPGGYDRLDRLQAMPHGRQTVRDMIHKVGGAELVQYMTTTPGGAALGEQLSNAPSGREFNRPTKRIYTAADLLARLEIEFSIAKKKAAAAKRPAKPASARQGVRSARST